MSTGRREGRADSDGGSCDAFDPYGAEAENPSQVDDAWSAAQTTQTWRSPGGETRLLLLLLLPRIAGWLTIDGSDGARRSVMVLPVSSAQDTIEVLFLPLAPWFLCR